jgi:4-amino-4-deoxy-L-arabinose transferase-like glycosyltransferase
MSSLDPGSLVLLRLPAALAAGALVLLTALLTRELRGGRAAQLLACAVTMLAPIVTGTGHLLVTFGFDMPVTALLCWLAVRILRTGEQRLWLVAGLAAGAGLLDTDLIAFFMFALVAGLAIAGPRQPLRSGWLYAGGAVALAMWAPYLAWQASHGWPELAVARSIAAGRTGTSAPWWGILPEQLILLPILSAPIWMAGLARLLRDRELRPYRAIGIAYPVLAVVFMATGGKPNYLAVMLPLLLAAGAQPAVDWIGRGQPRLRRGLLAAALVLSAAELPVTLPVVPVSDLQDTGVKPDSDQNETIGWPAFVQEIARVYHALPAAQRSSAVVVASNYGEAGAVDRFGPADGLPAAYSPETGFWYWGPPPASKTVAIIVGASQADVRVCGSARVALLLDSHVGVEEQGEPVWICTQLRESWADIWPQVRYLG